MIRVPFAVFLALTASAVSAGATVTEEDFEVRKTRNLINLCTVSPDDPGYVAAIHFCHGFLMGAYDYHVASAGPERPPMVCVPEAVSRDEAIAMFLVWAKRHPQYMDERPVDTEFRFLMATWPCN